MEQEKLVHTFSGGFSGSKIQLIKDENGLVVRKTGNVSRNYERMMALAEQTNVPHIFEYEPEKEILDMEYIRGLDMDTYLMYNSINPLVDFIATFLTQAKKDTIRKDYTETYEHFSKVVNYDHGFEFNHVDLMNRLPRYLPQTKNYHGDMTLENIIYSKPYFTFIDPVTSPFDSWVFDLAKLRQDLECKWFIRNSENDHTSKLQNIQRRLLKAFPLAKDNSLLILMLLRVYRHTEAESFEYYLLQEEMNRLWKLIK